MCVLYLNVNNLEPLRYDVENTVIYRPQTVSIVKAWKFILFMNLIETFHIQEHTTVC